MDNKEIRYLVLTPEIEFRALEDESGSKLAGYASIFNQLSNPMRYWKEGEGDIIFREKILEGAFDGALVNPTYDIFYNVDHEDRLLIATLFSKTLSLNADTKGLRFEASVDLNVSYAKDLYNNVKSGRIYSNSFAFTVAEEAWEKVGDKDWIRTISKVGSLFDVSSVSRAAYPNTELAARSLQTEIDKENEQKNNLIEDENKKQEAEKLIKRKLDEDFITRIRVKIKTRTLDI